LPVVLQPTNHLLLSGPPGSGKTMLAEDLPGVLPPVDDAQLLETYRVHSATGSPIVEPASGDPGAHHGISAPALVGGGSSWMRPGEVSLTTARVTNVKPESQAVFLGPGLDVVQRHLSAPAPALSAHAPRPARCSPSE